MQLLLICFFFFFEKLANLLIVERNYATFAWETCFQIWDSDSWKRQRPSRLTSFFFFFIFFFKIGIKILNNMGQSMDALNFHIEVIVEEHRSTFIF